MTARGWSRELLLRAAHSEVSPAILERLRELVRSEIARQDGDRILHNAQNARAGSRSLFKLPGPVVSDGARRLAKFRAGASDFSRFGPQGDRVLPRAQYSAQIRLVMGDLLQQRDQDGALGRAVRERQE